MKLRVLLVKLSSFGDVIHTIAALSPYLKSTDDYQSLNEITLEIDWLIEPEYEALVNRLLPEVCTLPVSVRSWRKEPGLFIKSRRWREVSNVFRGKRWDFIIDAQSLMKSGILAKWAKSSGGNNSVLIGLSKTSARESFASFLYDEKKDIPREMHAVDRLTQLFHSVFDAHELFPNELALNSNISHLDISELTQESYLIFFMGSAWSSKKMPIEIWSALARKAGSVGYGVKVTWGNDIEKQEAEKLALECNFVSVIEKRDSIDWLPLIEGSKGVISMDTGFGQLAALMGRPTLGLFSASSAGLTSFRGANTLSIQLEFPCSPCFKKNCPLVDSHSSIPPCWASIDAETIWQAFGDLMNMNSAESC